jgi:hypothetical protein
MVTSRPVKRIPAREGALVLLLLLSACSGGVSDPAAETAGAETVTAEAPAPIDFVASDFAFTGPPTLPSGWNTIRFRNDGEQTHFLTFWQLPEGVTFDQYTGELLPAFFEVFGPYLAGELARDDLVPAIRAGMPGWFTDMVNRGGPGLTGPGVVSETTVHLPAGTYVIECYVLTPEGSPHGVEGMLRPLIVTEESSGVTPPDADTTITLADYGFDLEAPLKAGTQTWAVRVADDPDGFLGYGLHLARLSEEDDLADLIAWSDWVDGLRAPSPALFLGGADAAPAGTTSYVTLTLEPGRYALVSKEYARRGMVHEFRIE